MSQSKLFDYNSSFSVTRANPKLSGNFRISVDSQGGVCFNSMSVNSILSNDRFKKYNISGNNTYASDVSKFFDDGKLSNDIIFDVGTFTNGDKQTAQEFSGEYDFYYASGASTLIDKNYTESFSYFAPLWIQNEIPDFFVIFKVPGPLDYPYSKNVTVIKSSIEYKVIQDYDSDADFIIAYGKTINGDDIQFVNGDIFKGNSLNSGYTIVSGSGKVAVFSELDNLPLVNDVGSTFSNKILPNAAVIKTFDLRANTKIGDYIRSIFNDPKFSKSPVDVNWGYNSYSYYKGVSVSEGIYTKKGELLNEFLTSSKSDPMIDLEEYITSGFSRNGIISPNLLNLEFLFDDDESDLYTINRYFGMYVSRNDINQVQMNGNFFYDYKDLSGNENTPKPTRNDLGYYYSNVNKVIGATSGVRLFYEGASGFLPGSDNVNILDSKKLFYITDKNDNFYSLKRSEDYVQSGTGYPEYSYGPFDYASGTFSATGSTGATSGSLVLQNTSINLHNFTGTDDKVATIKGFRLDEAGKAYSEIEFLKNYDLFIPLVIKLYWPNGSLKEGSMRYDLIKSGDFSSILPWTGGSYYSSGNSYYFNALTGTTSQVASALCGVIRDLDSVTIDSGFNNSSSIIRVKNSGESGNYSYSISIFDNYPAFVLKFKGAWNNSKAYLVNDIVLYNNVYYYANSPITPTSLVPHTVSPDQNTSWSEYNTFSNSGYVKINGTDVSSISKNVEFIGGTISASSRIGFSSTKSDLVKSGYYVKTDVGYSKITSITKFVDSPKLDPVTRKVIGFNSFTYDLVANIENDHAIIELGSDKSFNTYQSAYSNIGVFTFFDVKEFDFDFWSSNYHYTPTAETYKYYQIPPLTEGLIEKNVPYFVKNGQILYAGSIYNDGDLFYGATGYTSFSVLDPSLTKTIIGSTRSSSVVVFPAQYSNSVYNGTSSNYTDIGYTKDLESFNGFIGIQDILVSPKAESPTKEEIINYGKLTNEYEYLRENYTTSRANKSRIVPYIAKWESSLGTDSRGNGYRLNSSPAFSPTNFSPSFDRKKPDSRYLTHEWFLMEQPPRNFPVSQMNAQNSYLPYKIDLGKAKSADPNDQLYLPSYFTVEPSDYSPDFQNDTYYTKELFTPLIYSQSSGYYETIFRGVKIVLKKRSGITYSDNVQLDRYVQYYRGYEDYKFSAIIRPVPEDSTTIQAPVKYNVIENTKQKFIVFICDVVIKDQKVFEPGYTGGTGGDPILDYTLLYVLGDKEKLAYPTASGSKFNKIDDIKLSAGLDLSLTSGSFINTTKSPGIINIAPNSEYNTDLREEIHTYFTENTVGATASYPSNGPGSFTVPSISSEYPWPTGVGPTYVEFGKVSTGSSYLLTIPFSTSNPVIVPLGSKSIYKDEPVFQREGGENYFKSVLSRCSVSYITDIFNTGSPYIKYRTYEWDSKNSITTETSDSFELFLERPTKITKPKGTLPYKSYNGPQYIIGGKIETGYSLSQGLSDYPSILIRYSCGYDPIFRKIIQFDRDKSDTIIGDNSIDLSFRNCNFAPYKEYFGISRNLNYTKVSLGSPILALANKYPEGAVYPLIGITPIDKKDFNLFSSSWDPGYYDRYTNATNKVQVAGTRSMSEYKTFMGSKMMKTPDPISVNNYITLEISRKSGSVNVDSINKTIDSYIKTIQSITKSNSGTGIGTVGPYLSGVDYNKMDPNIFPDAEIFWQKFDDQNLIKGTIRLDRILRRYLLNSGIKQVFIDNMISEFGVGDPKSINDDINSYIDLNISPIYQGSLFDLYVKKSGNTIIPEIEMVRGDIFTSDRYKMGYSINSNYKLTKTSELIYGFEFPMEINFYYSLMFNFKISKI